MTELLIKDILEKKSKEEKYAQELAAITEISHALDMPCLIDWFKEFEAKETEEARFVKSLDRLDTAMSAAYYDKNRNSETKVWQEFSVHALNCLQNEDVSCVSEKACDILRKVKIQEKRK